MKLFLIAQRVNNNWDTYDSAVVCAPDEETARLTHPSAGVPLNDRDPRMGGPPSLSRSRRGRHSSWCDNKTQVNVTYLGEADASVAPGVVCASFNAG